MPARPASPAPAASSARSPRSALDLRAVGRGAASRDHANRRYGAPVSEPRWSAGADAVPRRYGSREAAPRPTARTLERLGVRSRGAAGRRALAETQLGRVLEMDGRVEAGEGDRPRHVVLREKPVDLAQRDPAGARNRKAVHAARDRREREARESALGRERQRVAIARRQQRVFVLAAAAPDRADRVDDPARRQGVTARQPHLAGRTAAEPAALLPQARAGCAMDGAVHAAAAEQARVRGVDEGVDVERGDVAAHETHARRLAHPSRLRTMSQRPSAPRSASTAVLNAPRAERGWTHGAAATPAGAAAPE